MFIRMNKLIRDYSEELEKKEGEISRMKHLLCGYESAIEEMQREKAYLSSNGAHHNVNNQFKYQNQVQLDTNIYINNLLRKLANYEDHLNF